MSNPCSGINWDECTRISDLWIQKYLKQHIPKTSHKLVIRGYTIRFSGTQYETAALVDCIAENIKPFALTPHDMQRLQEEGKDHYREAMKYFGDVDPERDGKYGELILFLFTESVLKAPMIAYKLSLLTNTNDQVKGGDGVFFGDYNGQPSLFIGESKIEQTRSTAITHALESLNRFHDEVVAVNMLKHELTVANKVIRKDLSAEQLDYLYDSLNPETETYKRNNKVHPILVMYNDSQIKDICKKATSNVEAESLLEAHLQERLDKAIEDINEKMDKYDNVQSVYLDFFFFPVSDVTKLRYALYKAIHNCDYRKKTS